MDKKQKEKVILAIISLILPLISLLTSLILKPSFFESSQRITPTMTQAPEASNEVTQIKLELEDINKRIDEVELKIANSEYGNENSSSIINEIGSEVSLMENRVQIIEDFIVDNPEKALSLILFEQDIEYLRKDVAKLDEISRWSYGTSIAVGASLLFFVGTYIYGIFHKSEENNNTKTTLEKNH
jgi:hypothetical protein